MNPNLKHMWEEVRTQKLPSHREFRPITPESRLEAKVNLKPNPDYTSKERKNVR